MDLIARMVYSPPDNAFEIPAVYQSGILWLTISQMVQLFRVTEAELLAHLEEDGAYASPALADFYTREFPVKFDPANHGGSKLETHYRHDWVLLVGHYFQCPDLPHFAQWSMQQIELGREMEQACAKFPIQPLKVVDGEADLPDDWLQNWQEAKKETLFESDNSKVWKVLEAHWLRQPLRFIYWGGSQAGSVREVIPVEVFQADGYRSIWFRGDCPLRGESRTFNIEKVEFCEAS